MWYSDKIAYLTDEIVRLTRLRDQHTPPTAADELIWWSEQDDRYIDQIFDLTAQRDAWLASTDVLAAADTEIDTTSIRCEAAFQRLEDYSRTSRRLARLAVDTGLLALTINLLWLPGMALLLPIIVLITVSVAVGIHRVHCGDHLTDIAFTADEDRIEALVRLELMVDQIKDGKPADAAVI